MKIRLRLNYSNNVLLVVVLSIVLTGCLGQTTQTPDVGEPSDLGGAIPEPSPSPIQPPASQDPTPAPDLTPTTPVTIPAESFHGIEIHNLPQVEPAQNAGSHWLRRNGLIWNQVEPEEGQRDWSRAASLEAEMQATSEMGLELILIIRGAPAWAQNVPGVLCGPIQSDKLSAFADFVAEAVSRYSAPPYNVKYWELGNEPDVDYGLVPPDAPYGCWGESNDEYYGGGYYAEMLKLVYPAVKSADPEAQVLVGGLLLDCDPLNPPETQAGSGQYRDCRSSRFLEGILENGGGAYFDGVSFHAYDYYFESFGRYGNSGWHSSWNTSGPVLSAKVAYLKDLLVKYGYGDKYLMNTESALICGRTGREPFCLTDDFENTKANYVPQSYATALANGLRANIWYSIRGWRGSALIDENQQPFLAHQAYLFSSEKLGGAAYTGDVTQFPNLLGYEFRKDGTRLWVIWALDEEPHQITLPTAPRAIFDAVGNPLPVAQELAIALTPIYVEWDSE